MCCISMVERGANSTLNLIRVTETQFADDTALHATFIELHLSQCSSCMVLRKCMVSDFGLRLRK